MRRETCPSCNGKRLKKDTLTVTIDKFSIADVTDLSITDATSWIKSLDVGERALTNYQEQQVAKPIIKEITARLTFLERVGLEYLSLGRSAATLAGGEAQRIRLASQIGSGLSGVLYVLDEPSIGLHPRDNTKLITTLKALRDLGNSVIVVEHDKEMMEESDYLVDFGPGAGEHGGNIIAKGTLKEVLANKHSITAPYLTEKKKINRPSVSAKQEDDKGSVILRGAHENNLKNIDVTFPLGKFICITGVSGSGKSTLIVETFYRALAQKVNPLVKDRPGAHTSIDNWEKIDKTIIDQSPIGRTPPVIPTYENIFNP
jgi:excinuclease ABC subunit A